MKKNDYFNKLLNIVKTVGITLAVILSIIQIWGWISTPKPDLLATVHYSPFKVPQLMKQDFSQMLKMMSSEQLENLIEKEGIIKKHFLINPLVSEEYAKKIKASPKADKELKQFVEKAINHDKLRAAKTKIGVQRMMSCIFRLIPATNSAPFRPPIPEHSGHLFRSIPATL